MDGGDVGIFVILIFAALIFRPFIVIRMANAVESQRSELGLPGKQPRRLVLPWRGRVWADTVICSSCCEVSWRPGRRTEFAAAAVLRDMLSYAMWRLCER